MDKDKLAEALRRALEMERTGRRFYLEAAESSVNDVVKRTFTFLADNETQHVEDIERFYRAMSEREELPALDAAGALPEREKELKLFSVSIAELKEKVRESKKDADALEFAMDLENKGYRHYKVMLESASDERLRELLDFLLSEESRHYSFIAELHAFITDSANWYMYEEKSFPQG